MSLQLPPNPYDLAEDYSCDTEPYWIYKWQMMIEEVSHAEDQRQVVFSNHDLFDSETEANEAGELVLVNYSNDEDWSYQITVKEIQVEAEWPDPDPDPDSRPGGHDDY